MASGGCEGSIVYGEVVCIEEVGEVVAGTLGIVVNEDVG